MKNYKLGFIGCGNMAQGILSGIFSADDLNDIKIGIYDIDSEKTKKIADGRDNVTVHDDIKKLTECSEIVFLCVKPNIMPIVAKEVSGQNIAFVSIAAGITTEQLKNMLHGSRILRIMPNTPLTVKKGATCFSKANTLNKDEFEFVRNIFLKTGIVLDVDEEKMNAVTGISGSGPAYVYYFIDAMIKAGQEQGLTYNEAFELTLQTIEGGAKMAKNSKKTPEELIVDVCSPGGTTIEAMKVFNDNNMDDIIKKGIAACTEKSRILSEKNNG